MTKSSHILEARASKTLTLEQAVKDYDWLGDVKQVHHVGPYDIVEYEKITVDRPRNLTGTIAFGTYIFGKKTSISYDSLDEALAGCIAYRAGGPNCQAAHFFIRGLGLKS